MKSIDFPKAMIVIAKNQPQYLPLFAHVEEGENKSYPVTVCFELDPEEIEEIKRTGKIWYTQLTFGNNFSPIRMSTVHPFKDEEIPANAAKMEEDKTPADIWKKTHYKGAVVVADELNGLHRLGPCENCGSDREEHYFTTLQCII